MYDCKCEPGYEGQDGGVCTACPAGKFKSVFGNSTCETCPENTFSHLASTSCSECPGNSTSEPQSVSINNCLCNAGFSGVDGGPCILCEIGKFKDSAANTACEFCADNTFSENEGATSCVLCSNNSAHSVGRDRCLCNAGYTQADTVDTRPDCTPCPVNTYQSDSGQTSCNDCDANANGPEASITPFLCLCNAGFYDVGDNSCSQCAAGKYKDPAPNMDDDETPCPLCPVNSHSPVQSDSVIDCICNAGFEGPDGGACTACLAGKFKAENGSAPCEDCPLNFFSDNSASVVCTSCVTFLNSNGAITINPGSDSSDDCICDVDQGFVGILDTGGARTCTGCQAGTYATAEGCENCTGGQYADVAGLTACKNCPANASSYDYPHVACQCHAGYYCAPTMQGAVLPEVSITSIINTNGGRHWPRLYDWDYDTWTYIKSYVDTKCVDLPGYQYSNIYSGSDSYQAGVDFIKNNGPCAANQAGVIYATDEANSVECIFAVAQDGDGNDWLVNVWLYRWYLPPEAQEIYGWPNSDNENGRVYFEFLTEAVLQGNTWSEQLEKNKCAGMWTGASDIPDWGSIPDYQLTLVLQKEQNTLQEAFTDTCPTGDCVACPVDTFKNYTGGADNCYDCQANSVSDLASVSQDDCECDLGFRQDGPDTCVACLAGRYADTLDSITCTACGDRFYTAQSDFPWTSVVECTQCQVCSAPTYQDHYDAANQGLGCGNGTATDCQACPEHKSLLEAFTIDNWQAGAESCKCDPGYEPVDSSIPSTCQTCAFNFFKSSVGDVQCTACPSTTVTEFEGADSLDSCVCPSGYYFDQIDGIPCVLCAPDTYKTGLSRQAVCDPCTNHSTSEAGSDESSDCLCLPGFGAVGGPATTMSLHMARWQSERGTFYGNVIAPEEEILQATSPEQVGNYDRYQNKPKSVELMSQLQSYITSPCNSGDYSGSLAEIAEKLTQSPCASNYGNELYATSHSISDSCLFMAVDYTVDGVTHKSPAVVYLNLVKDWDNKYYQLMIRIYQAEGDVQYDLTNQKCAARDSNDPAIIGGTPTSGDWQFAETSLPVTLFLEPSLESSCEICSAGEQKNVTANEPCEVCEVNTFAVNLGTRVCEQCETGKSTISLTGQSYCECDAGTERESSDVLSVCQDCAEGKYKTNPSYDEPNCQNCSHCGAHQQVDTVCDQFNDLTCKPCQDNSWSNAGRTELGPCFCNAGYELVDSQCVACPVGKARTTNYNNSIACETCQDGKFADTEAATECEFCASHCNGTIGGPFGFTGLLGKFVYKTIPFTRVQWVSGVGESLGIPEGDQRWQTGTYNNPELVDYGFETSTFEQDAAALWDLITQNMPECPGDTLPPTDASHPWNILKQAYSADFTTLDQVTSLADDPQYQAQIEPYLNGGQCTYHPPATGVFRPSSDNIAYTNIGKYIIHPIEVPRDPNNPSEKMTLLNVLFHAWWGEEHVLDPSAGSHVNADVFQKKWPIYSCTLSPKGWRDFFNERYYNKDPWTKNYVWYSNMIIDHFNLFGQTPNLNYNVIDSNGVQTNDYRQVYFNLGVGSSSSQTYVTEECEVTKDTVCTACTSCPPGQYAIQSCGIPFNNDRNDTKCALCPAGFYCPGGTDNDGADIKPETCPDLSTSSPGSDSILDCQCAPGYFHNGEVCQLCILDTYCPGENVVQNCPVNAITHDVGNIHRLDCHCLSGHYRNPPEDALNFNCSVCTPNDYCFNNSLYDCPDVRMISNSGSISFKNCTCMDGYYNNGSTCEECPIDHFCFDGNVFECASREWTNNLQRQSKCVCRPGFFRSEESCTFCDENFYCDGTDDFQKQCPSNSISSANSSSLQECLCVPGYGHIHAQNYTLAHTCVLCESGKFKDKHGMYLCTPCRKCLAINNIYELHACTNTHDSVCDSCDTCHKNHPDDDPRFVQEACADHQNAICGPCSTCNFTNQYERIQCSPETGDTVCTDIIKTSEECLSGQYRGSHTMYSQSICSACQFRDTKYHGMTLHVASGTGLEYDNAYSCPIQCLGNSVLRDVSDMSLGCRSCEAGNVLLRNINVLTDMSGNKVNCSFTCRNGYNYDPVRDDCFVSSLESSEENKFEHTFEISNFQHEINGFSLRVTHTNHGKFMVVIGASEPSDCRKNFCCQSNLWRVSTLEQAGLNPSIHSDSCSKSNELNQVASTQIDANTLSFSVSDSIVNEVGTCTNAANGTVSCLFTVSMIDLILRKSISRQIVIQTKHSVQYAFVNNPQKYIPLSFLQADILFLYNVSEMPYFQMTLQLKSDTDMHISTRVSGSNQLDKEMLQPCPRLSNSIGVIYQNVSESVLVSKDEIVTLVSYWYGTTNQFYENEIPFSHFLAYLTLQIGGPESSNIMDVAVSRKLSLLNNLCHVHTHTATLNLGHILYTAGLGQSTINNLIDHNANFVQARGEIGTMFTFLAYSELPETETISLERGMAVHLSKPNLLTTTELNQAVNFSSSSNLEFTPSFRTKCFDKRPNCVYGYFNNFHNSNPIFTLNNCSEYNKKQAQEWISSQMGAANDQGHISSLCSVMQSLHAFSTKAFLINSMSFVDKRNAIWNTYQNWTSPGTSTNVWAKFRFDTSV